MGGSKAKRLDSVDRFGFIPVLANCETSEFVIEPIGTNTQEIVRALDSAQATDGFIYPPTAATLLFKLPPTHQVRRRDGQSLGEQKPFRQGVGWVLAHGTAMMFGLRAQFDGWWFDGRVPSRSHEICSFSMDQLGEVLERFVSAYRSFPERTARRFLSVLYVKNRAISYKWSWEEFLFQYSVFDAIYKCLCDVRRITENKKKRTPHKKRFEKLAKAGLIHWSDEEEKQAKFFVDLRNDLVHETMWADGTPSRDDSAGMRAAGDLRRLNERLFLQLVGVRCGYVRSPWNTFSCYLFEPEP